MSMASAYRAESKFNDAREELNIAFEVNTNVYGSASVCVGGGGGWVFELPDIFKMVCTNKCWLFDL